jgi:hypothetical protein
VNERFNFSWSKLLPEEVAQLESIRTAVDARRAAEHAAMCAEWELLGEGNGRGRRVRPSDHPVDLVVLRVTKTTIVTQSFGGKEYTFQLTTGREKEAAGRSRWTRALSNHPYLELVHASQSIIKRLAIAGQDPRNQWALKVANALAETAGGAKVSP